MSTGSNRILSRVLLGSWVRILQDPITAVGSYTRSCAGFLPGIACILPSYTSALILSNPAHAVQGG